MAEMQVKDVQAGQSAKIAFLQSSFVAKGRVTQVRPGVVNGVVTIDVQVDAVPATVARPPAQVDGTIQVGGVTNVVYVGRPVVANADHEGVLFRVEPDGLQAVRVKMLFGKSSVNQIEIRSGLRPGDRVILSDMSAVKDHERIYLK